MSNYSSYLPDVNGSILQRVSKCGYELAFVLDKLKTPEICLAAVKNDPQALQFVPEELQTTEMLCEAVRADLTAYYHIKRHKVNEDIALELVKKDGMMLTILPPHLLTERVLAEAAEQVRTLERAAPMDGLEPEGRKRTVVEETSEGEAPRRIIKPKRRMEKSSHEWAQ